MHKCETSGDGTFTFSLGNKTFRFRAEPNETENLAKSIEYLQTQVAEMAESHRALPLDKMLVAIVLNLSGELNQLKAKTQIHEEFVNNRVEKLIKRIDLSLAPEQDPVL